MKDKRWRVKKIITPEAQAAAEAMMKKAIEESERARKEAIEAARLVEEKQLLKAKQKAEEEERRQVELAEVIRKNQECVEAEMRRIEMKRFTEAVISATALKTAMEAARKQKEKADAEAYQKQQEEDKIFVLNHPAVRQLSAKAKLKFLEGGWNPRTQRLVLEGNVDAFRHHWETLARGKTVRFE